MRNASPLLGRWSILCAAALIGAAADARWLLGQETERAATPAATPEAKPSSSASPAPSASAPSAQPGGGRPGTPPGGEQPKIGPDGKPIKPEDDKSKSEGKPDGKTDAAAVVPRPATPPQPPNPDEFKVRPDADGKVQFQFRNQPWPDLLRWLADVSDLSLDWQELPGDYLNLATQRPYSLVETRDTINRHLLARGFTLLEHEGVLSV
ncbi:MAG: hypothetical protein ACTHK7_10320, partial [Aureliella sp.]